MAMLPAGSGSAWSAKHYIVAVLVGVLFAVALAAVVSIALAPAHLSFSVEDPGMPLLQEEGEARKGQYYRFTLVADNPSRRMWVSYGGYLYTEIWPSDTAWIPGHVDYSDSSSSLRLQEWQRPGTTIRVTVLAESWQFDQQQAQNMSHDIIHARHDANSTVVVKAEVRFKLGLARTMPYTVTVTCLSVNFTNSGTYHSPAVQCL